MSAAAPFDHSRKTSYSRQNSTAVAGPANTVNPKTSPVPLVSRQVHYTCFIRLPFNRNGLEDPEPVEWNSDRDKVLWRLISEASSSDGLDWEEISHQFQVPLSFVLQQVAWLYERHFERMRAQMRKLSSPTSGLPGSRISTESASKSSSGPAGIAMERTGSRESKVTSASGTTANQRSGTAPLLGDGLRTPISPKTTTASSISRTHSSSTVTQSRVNSLATPKPSQQQESRPQSSGSEQRFAWSFRAAVSPQVYISEETGDPALDVDSEEDDDAPALTRDRVSHHRSPTPPSKAWAATAANPATELDEGEDDDDDLGNFLPFAAASTQPTDKGSSLTTAAPAKRRKAAAPHSRDSPPATTSSQSSGNSSSQPRLSSSGGAAELVQRPPPGPLSPRHRAQLTNTLTARPPRRDGSDGGSLSMGSSFSDLDDASITQSALEDAVLSNMRQGGSNLSTLASRASSLRDALGRRS